MNYLNWLTIIGISSKDRIQSDVLSVLESFNAKNHHGSYPTQQAAEKGFLSINDEVKNSIDKLSKVKIRKYYWDKDIRLFFESFIKERYKDVMQYLEDKGCNVKEYISESYKTKFENESLCDLDLLLQNQIQLAKARFWLGIWEIVKIAVTAIIAGFIGGFIKQKYFP